MTDIKPKYETIFHSQVLKAVELSLSPETKKYHSVTDIIPTTDRKRWIVELYPDHGKRLNAGNNATGGSLRTDIPLCLEDVLEK